MGEIENKNKDEMEIYDVTELMKNEDAVQKIGAFTKYIRPNKRFRLIWIRQVVKNGDKYDEKQIKGVLCDEKAEELLMPHWDALFGYYENGKLSIMFGKQFKEEDLFEMQEKLNLSEDEILVAKKVEEGYYKIEKMKVSELPLKPFPEITNELVERLKIDSAKEELEEAKKEIEMRHGVKLD